MSLDWWIPDDCEADLIALVDLESSNVWLFKMTELKSHAQQKSNGRFHFFMTVDPHAPPRKDKRLVHVYEFQRFLIGNVIPRMTEEGKS